MALRETVQQTVHDDGAGHEVIFLHASQAAGLLSSQFDEVVATLVQTMKDHDPRSNKVQPHRARACTCPIVHLTGPSRVHKHGHTHTHRPP